MAKFKDIELSINNRKSILWLQLIATIFTFGIVLIPDLNTITTEVILCDFMLWIFCPKVYRIKIPQGLRFTLYLLTVYFIIALFYKFIGLSTAWLDIQAGYFGCLVCAWISVASLFLFSKLQLYYIKWGIYTVSIAAMVYVSIKGLNNLRSMNLEEAISQESAAYGSSLMIFSGVSFLGLIYTKKRILKFAYIIGIILSIYVTIVIMQRGTNTIMLIGLLLAISCAKFIKNYKLKKTIIICGSIIAFFYYSGFISIILDFVIENFASERLAQRFMAIQYFIEYGDALEAGSSLKTRTELLDLSMNTFSSSIENILFGVGDSRSANSLVGNHSELVDSFARYGIFVGLILTMYFYLLMKWWYDVLPRLSSLRYQVLFILLVYLARNIWGNALTSAISVYVFIYLPLVVYPFFKKYR